MKSKSLLILVTLLSLVSCNKQESSTSGSSTPVKSSHVVSNNKSEAIADLNAKLNSSEQYRFTKDELDLLLSQGAVSESEYQELLALVDGGAQ